MYLERITLRGRIVYEKVHLLSIEEQRQKGIPDFLGDDAQIVFKCSEGIYITSAFHTIVAHVSSHKKKIAAKSCSYRLSRITLSGDNVYSNVCVLEEGKHGELGIPIIFKPPLRQFIFSCGDGLFIANTFHMINLQI